LTISAAAIVISLCSLATTAYTRRIRRKIERIHRDRPA
jgi:hypothetical protein